MNYEKKYKEAMKACKELSDTFDNETLTEELEKIFPELKESEDERIRKALIYHYQCDGFLCTNGYRIDYKDIRAWLEKQGEQPKKPADKVEPKFKVGDKIWHKNYKGECTHHIIRIENDNYIGDDNTSISISTADKEYELVEKQGEQKPADVRTIGYWHVEDIEQKPTNKVEPKFKNGQWIVWQDKYYKVINNGCCYELVDQDGLSTSLEYGTIDENARLWDITKDAKDGDVLADGNLPFIFKKIDSEMHSYAYCGISVDDGFKIESDGESGEWTWMQDIKPATKEQRDLLFQKMKEEGYEWDAEKKELKKIEQKPWSEEDEIKETIRCALLSCCNGSAINYKLPYDGYEKCLSWLKSLRPQSQWKPSDEQMKALYDSIPENVMEISEREMLLNELYKDLRKEYYGR